MADTVLLVLFVATSAVRQPLRRRVGDAFKIVVSELAGRINKQNDQNHLFCQQCLTSRQPKGTFFMREPLYLFVTMES